MLRIPAGILKLTSFLQLFLRNRFYTGYGRFTGLAGHSSFKENSEELDYEECRIYTIPE